MAFVMNGRDDLSIGHRHKSFDGSQFCLGSGYDDSTANLYLSLSLNKQLEYYKEFQAKVVGMVGEANASSIFSGGFVRKELNLYSLGARSIGVMTSLPPLGCLPGMITLFGFGKDECVDPLNYDALSFNRRLNSTSQALK
ncbi:hypothetical protein G4B88_015710 [Cannabis sativa]|uniref:GDSL esterase/lipase n=1 Tax=Cannabis sativa TaxID=3483 RepID=A0A7J6H8A8_CANSA|nr:hypothetical protein G4B88_015710 [Cannabis sativa]